jgi:hypothetical protein
MTDSRYAIPADDLVASVRVDRTDQVEVQADPVRDVGDWSAEPQRYGDGAGGGADCD